MRIRMGREREAHVDDEPHAESAQLVVVMYQWHTANEEVIGDLREVHAGNRITKIFVNEPYSSTMIFPCVPSTRIF